MEKIVQSTTEIDLDGDTWVAEWCSYIIRDGSETTDRWLVVSRKESDGTLISIDDLDADSNQIVQLLSADRVRTIQSEYGIPSPDVDEVAIAEQILARVWAGEWMGQPRNSYYFYVDHLAAILGKEYLDAADIVAKLGVAKKAGLNGDILIPWEEEEAAYKSWENSTGHKLLLVNDFGGWNCQYCGNWQDERGTPARDVPCELPVKKEQG